MAESSGAAITSSKEIESLKVNLLSKDEKQETRSIDPVEEFLDDVEDPASGTSNSWERGEKQATSWQDVPFALLFHGQSMAVAILSVMYGVPTVKDHFRTDEIDLSGINKPVYPLLLAIGSATLFMVLILTAVVIKARLFISCSIIFNALFTVCLAIAAFQRGNAIFGALLGFSGLMGCLYFFLVRHRIPFAAANLHAGATAIRDNARVVLLAYTWGWIFIGWLILWTAFLYTTIDDGLLNVCDDADTDDDTDDDTDAVADADDCHLEMSRNTKIYIVLLVLSFYWTQQVSSNVLHTTVAGVVGTWYFDPQDTTLVWASTVRTLTYSFGSVCFGSLLVAIISTFRFILAMRDPNNDSTAGSVLYCVLDCILSMFETIMEYFNKWAFIYVGLYGYPYIKAGKKVTSLFQQRGWTVLINDQLIARVLNFTSYTVGLCCGTVQYLAFPDEKYLFIFGFVFGVLFSHTMMNVVDSAVCTIIVCFAEAPEELESSHPNHSRKMKKAWYDVYQVQC